MSRGAAISRAVPNIRTDRPAETRDFFVDLFGFEVAMDPGWAMTVASPNDPSVQITIVGGDDMAAPGITVEWRMSMRSTPRLSSGASRSPIRCVTRDGGCVPSCSAIRAGRL
jgi:hypothetical protein